MHLPVAIAHFLEEGRCLDPATLWAAVDDGSWVTPQLMAALRRSDPRLVERVVERLERLGEPDDGVGERLAALGKRPKYIASLLDTAAGLPALSTQVDAWRSRRVVAEGLEADERADRSGAISRQWEERVLRALAG
ncbi:MAG: hypothetical protein IT384_18300 [Deltaproteobacteria bacterium]|nr:hypothetical protein [Deltaproteobacteria bacterium]